MKTGCNKCGRNIGYTRLYSKEHPGKKRKEFVCRRCVALTPVSITKYEKKYR